MISRTIKEITRRINTPSNVNEQFETVMDQVPNKQIHRAGNTMNSSHEHLAPWPSRVIDYHSSRHSAISVTLTIIPVP